VGRLGVESHPNEMGDEGLVESPPTAQGDRTGVVDGAQKPF
jgi:hypothetical protein